MIVSNLTVESCRIFLARIFPAFPFRLAKQQTKFPRGELSAFFRPSSLPPRLASLSSLVKVESTRREGKVNIALAYYSLLKSSCEESSHARPTFITLRSLDSRSKSDAVERASSRNCGAHWELLLLFYFAYTGRGGCLTPFPMFDPESGRGAHFRRKLRNIFSAGGCKSARCVSIRDAAIGNEKDVSCPPRTAESSKSGSGNEIMPVYRTERRTIKCHG